MLPLWVLFVMLAAGVALLLLELFVPGFTIPGITGLILCLVSLYFMAAQYDNYAVPAALGAMVVLIGGGLLLMRSVKKGRLSRSALVNKDEISRFGSFEYENEQENLIGKKGIAVTTLRPAGLGEFDGMRFDVVTNGEFIQQGTDIRIVRVEGRRIIVHKD